MISQQLAAYGQRIMKEEVDAEDIAENVKKATKPGFKDVTVRKEKLLC
jgi:hypothetical protein